MENQVAENVAVESCEESDEGKKKSENQVVPAYMGAVMRRQFLQEMVKNLPESIQNRLTALKAIQKDHLLLEADFFEEVYKLERKFQEKYQPLFDRRRDIVNGIVEPEKQTPTWKVEPYSADEERFNDFDEVLKDLPKTPESAKGIPNFWLTIFRNTELLSEMVQDHDEPALKKLTDIKIVYDNVHSYTLEFYFDKNEYFSNAMLTKQYFLKATVDDDYPFGFEGPEIYKCKGCNIDWEKKMNLTVKTIRKKQKHKTRGAVRTTVKQVPNDSFFNFFNPPDVAEDDEETQGILATDFEIGHFIRARIIPKAVLYYTGDIVDDDDDDDEYDCEEEDEDDSDGDDNAKKVVDKKTQNPNECPNQ